MLNCEVLFEVEQIQLPKTNFEIIWVSNIHLREKKTILPLRQSKNNSLLWIWNLSENYIDGKSTCAAIA